MRFHTVMDHGRLHGAFNPLRRVIEVGDRIALLGRTNGRGVFYATRCHTLVYRDIEINHPPGGNKSGAVPRNIEIVGNRFEDCWYAENAQPFGVIAARMNGRIEVTRGESGDVGPGNGWRGIADVRIERDLFRGWHGGARVPGESRSTELAEHPEHAISLRDVSNVRVVENESIPPVGMPAAVRAVHLADHSNVVLQRNTFRNWPGGRERTVPEDGGSGSAADSTVEPVRLGD